MAKPGTLHSSKQPGGSGQTRSVHHNHALSPEAAAKVDGLEGRLRVHALQLRQQLGVASADEMKKIRLMQAAADAALQAIESVRAAGSGRQTTGRQLRMGRGAPSVE